MDLDPSNIVLCNGCSLAILHVDMCQPSQQRVVCDYKLLIALLMKYICFFVQIINNHCIITCAELYKFNGDVYPLKINS